MSITSDLALAHRLADAAGEAIRPLFRSNWAHEAKADASPVTEADRAAEAAMRRLLDAEAPRDGIIGEEYGAERPEASRQWVLDPIDGTVSFMAGRPIFGRSLSLICRRFLEQARLHPDEPWGTAIPRCWNACPVSILPRGVRWMNPCWIR